MLEIRVASYIFSALALCVIGLFVLLNNPKKLSNRWLFVFTVTVLAWILALNFADNFNNLSLAESASRAAFALGGLIFYCLYQFSRYFPRDISKKTRIISWTLVLPVILFIIMSPSVYAVQSVKIVDYGAEVRGGVLYQALAFYIVVVFILTLYNLFRNRKDATSVERQQLRFMSYGLLLFAVVALGSNLFLVILGYSELGFLGPPSVLLFLIPTAYAIVRHRLFNIRAVVARSLAYIFSIVAFALLYAFLAFGLAQGVLLKNILTTENSREIFNVVLAVILAFTFPAIRRFFERATDRVFYRDRYDPQQLVSDIGRVLASEILLERLSKKVLSILSAQMHLENSNIVVISDGELFYQTHSNKTNQIFQAVDLVPYRKGVTITDELMSGDKRAVLDRHSVRAVFPLRTTEAFVGYLLLGDKRSGDIFSSQDVQTLTIIANELAIAINNARSYQEIQRFNETLREKVRRATVDLRHANTELKELDKAKDEFISMASHQLRTPLTAVRGYTSMVMDGDFGRISKSQQETLQQAFDAATRMTRLVDDLLNVSRIQSGKFKIERTEVDLNKIIPEEISLLATAAEMKHVAMEFHTPKKPVPILQIDEGKTRQCLMNLMDNAIYYSSTVESGGKVDIHLEADTDWVSFWVVDNGIGVPKAEQAKLFQKFYRAPNAQKTRPDGTGLGLFLVGRVTKDQGGEVIFESEEGKGSTFGFKLPIRSAGEGIGR